MLRCRLNYGWSCSTLLVVGLGVAVTASLTPTAGASPPNPLKVLSGDLTYNFEDLIEENGQYYLDIWTDVDTDGDGVADPVPVTADSHITVYGGTIRIQSPIDGQGYSPPEGDPLHGSHVFDFDTGIMTTTYPAEGAPGTPGRSVRLTTVAYTPPGGPTFRGGVEIAPGVVY